MSYALCFREGDKLVNGWTMLYVKEKEISWLMDELCFMLKRKRLVG